MGGDQRKVGTGDYFLFFMMFFIMMVMMLSMMMMMMLAKMKSSLEKRWGEIRGKWEQVII